MDDDFLKTRRSRNLTSRVAILTALLAGSVLVAPEPFPAPHLPEPLGWLSWLQLCASLAIALTGSIVALFSALADRRAAQREADDRLAEADVAEQRLIDQIRQLNWERDCLFRENDRLAHELALVKGGPVSRDE